MSFLSDFMGRQQPASQPSLNSSHAYSTTSHTVPGTAPGGLGTHATVPVASPVGTGTFGSAGGAGAPIHVGSIVEYFSASAGSWILAEVKAVRHDGTYDLDCKPGVSADRIRAVQQQVPPGGFEIGSVVEYWSDSQNSWIPARVLGYDPNAGYNLDCKPQVPAAKIRHLTPGTAEALRSAPGTADALQSAPGTAGNMRGQVETAPTFNHLGAIPVQQANAYSPFPRAPALASTAVPHQEAPVQLIQVSRRAGGPGAAGAWHFAVNEEGVRILEAYGQRPVAVCTVCGPYRTGKSYLLNLLLGRIQQGATQFRVGSTTQACTEGIWMWGASDAASSSSDTALLFMDCEGFGSTEADKTRDAKLMSLCMLISSVFLLNTKGVLNEGLFNALSLVVNLAQHIEDKGAEASKPALMWLLRDFVLELRDPETQRLLQPDEYLEQSLHARPTASANADRSRAALEVREHLLKFFPRRHCQTLVVPIVDEEKLGNLAQVPYGELRPEFRQEFEAARAQILSLAREKPKTIGGKAVSGGGLAGVLRRLVDSINSEKALNVSSAWDGVQHGACQNLSEELRATAIAELQKVRNGAPLPVPGGRPLPVSDDELAQALKEARKSLWEVWRSRAVGDDAVKEEYWQELEQSLGVEERELERANVAAAEQPLAVAGAAWAAWLSEETANAGDPRSEALAQLIDKGMPGKLAARVAREALNASRLARIRWDGSMHALKAEMQLLSDSAASKKAAEQASPATDNAALESTRELGRLQGQVETLQNQAKDAIQREKKLKDMVLEAEESTRKEQRASVEIRQKCTEHENKIRELESIITELKNHHKEAEAAAQDTSGETKEVDIAKKQKSKPKCGCSVM